MFLNLFLVSRIQAQTVLNEVVRDDFSYASFGSSVQIGTYVYYITTTKEKFPFSIGPEQLTLMKVALNGVVVSSTILNFPENVIALNIDLKKTVDQNLLITYYKEIGTTFRTHVRKVDVNGNLLWETTAVLPGGFTGESLGDVCVHPDGNIFISGTAYDTSGIFMRAYLWKVGPNGTNEWFKTFGGANGAFLGNTVASSGSNIYLGFVDNTDITPQGSYYQHGSIVKIDPLNGDSLSSVYLGPGFGMVDMELINEERLMVLSFNQSQGICYATTTNLLGGVLDSVSFSAISFIGLVKEKNGLYALGVNNGLRSVMSFSTTGSLLWSQDYSSSASSYSTSLTILTNGKALLFGRRSGSSAYDYDLLVTQLSKQSCTVPLAEVAPSPIASFCWNSPVLLSSVDTSVGNLYQWTRYGVVLPGTTSTYAASKAGNYKLQVTSSTWCTAKTANVFVSNETPASTVTQSGPTSFCVGDSVVLSVTDEIGYTYEWFRYSTPLSGETNSFLVVKTGGVYKCKISTASGCMRPSANTSITVTNCLRMADSEKGIKKDTQLSISPNPFTLSFTLNTSDAFVHLEIIDMLGKIVKGVNNFSTQSMVPTEDIPSGVYYVRVYSEDKVFLEKIIKQ